MQNFYFLDFFKNKLNPELLDSIRFELNNSIYYYGEQFKHPKESNKNNYFKSFRRTVKQLFVLYKIMQNRKTPSNQKVIFSNAYFSVNEELEKRNYKVYCPSWNMSSDRNVLSDFNVFSSSERIKLKIQTADFNELISPEFALEVNEFEQKLKSFFIKRGLKALIVPNDMSFFENLSIRVCKQIGIPSFVFLHGLPGRYNNIDENRSDYLVVWGEKIKTNYIEAGMDPAKIFVSGHPYYKEFKNEELKFSLDNILIITHGVRGSQHSDEVVLMDRGNSILYLYSIQETLKRLGVKSARFRPHPSENSDWYLKFIDHSFYKVDEGGLRESIESSSLVIGSMSTVFLESLYYGVSYLVYAPSVNNIDITNTKLVPPLDGEDSRVPVAKNEGELYSILRDAKKVDGSVFSEYIKTPFDLSFIDQIIK
jgi:hypothetical protein